MATRTPKLPAVKRRRSKLDEQVDQLLEEREGLEATIAKAEAVRDAGFAEVERSFQEAVDEFPSKLGLVDQKLAALMERHHYPLTSRHSKTINRSAGVIKVVVRAVEMDTPANTKPVINYLLCRRGGRKYLKVTYSLDMYALRYAPQGLKAALQKRFGFWWGRHRTISVKSPSGKSPAQLSRRRYNERS